MKPTLFDKLIERIDRLETSEIQSLIMRLMKQKGILGQVFEVLRDAVFIVDINQCIVFSNPAGSIMFGISANNLAGRRLEELLRGIDWSSYIEKKLNFSTETYLSYPEPRWVNLLFCPLADAENNFLLLVRDISAERERSETELSNEALGAVQFLAAGVAHEIGNPLNSISIHLQLLRRAIKRLPAAQAGSLLGHLQVAESEVQRLDSILKQFLGALRPNTLNKEPANLNHIVAEALALMAPELQQQKISVKLELDADLPDLALDSTRMGQVLYNLIKNAAQSMPVGVGQITIKTGFNDYEIKLSLSDNGSGIAPEVMGTMFEAFQSTKASGNGLGMFIIQRIVREHGGVVEIHSVEQQGTMVSIMLPRHENSTKLLGKK